MAWCLVLGAWCKQGSPIGVFAQVGDPCWRGAWVPSPEAFPETLPPTGVLRRPAHLPARLGVRGAPDQGHDRDRVLADDRAYQPGWQPQWRLRPDHGGQVGQPLPDRGRLVV